MGKVQDIKIERIKREIAKGDYPSRWKITDYLKRLSERETAGKLRPFEAGIVKELKR